MVSCGVFVLGTMRALIRGQPVTDLGPVGRLRTEFAEMLRQSKGRAPTTDQGPSIIEQCRAAEAGISVDFDDSLMHLSSPPPPDSKFEEPKPVVSAPRDAEPTTPKSNKRKRESSVSVSICDALGRAVAKTVIEDSWDLVRENSPGLAGLLLKVQQKSQELIKTLRGKRRDLQRTKTLIQQSAERREKLLQLVAYFERLQEAVMSTGKPNLGEPEAWSHLDDAGHELLSLVSNTEYSLRLGLETATRTVEADSKRTSSLEADSIRLVAEIAQLEAELGEAAKLLGTMEGVVRSALPS